MELLERKCNKCHFFELDYDIPNWCHWHMHKVHPKGNCSEFYSEEQADKDNEQPTGTEIEDFLDAYHGVKPTPDKLTLIEVYNGREISELSGRVYVYVDGDEYGFHSLQAAKEFIVS